MRSLAVRAGGLALFQVLSREDAKPVVGTALRMEDAETAEYREIVLDGATVQDYLVRPRTLDGRPGGRVSPRRGQVSAPCRGPFVA